MIELRAIDALSPAAYNPRTTDPGRLALVALSLRKLGWLLPVYITGQGEILSGHQRVLAARSLGASLVPVEVLDISPRDAVKVNILFNRATNDLSISDSTTRLCARVRGSRPEEMAEGLPDVDLNTPAAWPCLALKNRKVDELVKRNILPVHPYAANVTDTLARFGVLMPLVATAQGRVVNGLGRLHHLARSGAEKVKVVEIDPAKADLAHLLLNSLSMDFDLQGKAGDFLRANAARRHVDRRKRLGSGFIFPIHKGNLKSFDLRKRQEEWRENFGTRVLDFGAGHGIEADMLRSIGVEVTTFEPYPADACGVVDVEASRALARRFLQEVAQARPYDSVFLSSVLNSIPFPEDRQHVVCICASLCSRDSRLFAVARGARASDWQWISQEGGYNHKSTHTRVFPLSSEPGTTLGNVSQAPKIQKFHTQQEFYELFKEFFQTVQVAGLGTNVTAMCAGPGVSYDRLRRALKFEFDLPFQDGSRMGLVPEALEAFSKRLEVRL